MRSKPLLSGALAALALACSPAPTGPRTAPDASRDETPDGRDAGDDDSRPSEPGHATILAFDGPVSVTLGDPAVLTWQTREAVQGVLATSDRILRAIVPEDLEMGQAVVIPIESTTYVLVVKGPDGKDVTANHRITVAELPANEPPENPEDTPDAGTTPADPRPTGPAQAFARFGACMSIDDWNATYGVSQSTAVAFQPTSAGPCYMCHSGGTGAAFLSASSDDTFAQSRIPPFMLKLVTPAPPNPDGSYNPELVPSNRFRDKGRSGGSHPSFDLSDARRRAVDEMIDRTLVKYRDFDRACP